jgi:serine/threonine-protein kinase
MTLPKMARAEATAGQKAAAESLFDDALKAMKAGHYSEACPKLEESERIDPGIGTLLYLGECYERTGRTASAWAIFREAASSARAQGEVERSRVASARADRLQAGLSKLTIRVPSETARLASLHVTRDGVAVANGLLGVAIPVDPGKYHVVASADGHQSFEGDLEVPAGESKALEIPDLQVVATVEPSPLGAPPASATNAQEGTPSAAPPRNPEPGASSSAKTGLRVPAYVTGALGVVGLGIGSYFGVKAIAKNSDAESHCPRGNLCDDAQGEALTHEAKNAAVASNIAFGVGAAFVIAGVVLYLSGEPAEQSGRFELHPLASRDLAGLAFAGAFR